MPSGGIHLCVAKSVEKKLNMRESMNFYIGNVAPDSWRNSNSTKAGTHFIDSSTSLDYDYEYFYEKYQDYLNNDFVYGYLVHLITDKYWHGNHLTSTKNVGSEWQELIKACSILVGMYEVPRLEMPNSFFNPVEELETSGIEKTVNYLNSVNYLDEKNTTFDIVELVSCIEETSEFVVSELERLKISDKKKQL